jgi:ribosome-associated toxin RatA of RatAB toxin-antitoxin module
VSATATLGAPYDLIWSTLTDYGHLAEFVPGMKVSRIVERRGSTVVVEQEGAAKFLVFSHAIKVTVESIEEPPSVIGIRVVKGNLKQLNGRYEIEALQAPQSGYVLRWSGVIEPQLAVPEFIGVPLLRANVADQFVGLVNEIERRDAQRRATLAAR